MKSRRNRAHMTPAQKQWDSINRPDVPYVRRTLRQRTAMLYRNIHRMAFGDFARETAATLGVVAEYDTAQQSMMHLVSALEANDDSV